MVLGWFQEEGNQNGCRRAIFFRLKPGAYWLHWRGSMSVFPTIGGHKDRNGHVELIDGLGAASRESHTDPTPLLGSASVKKDRTGGKANEKKLTFPTVATTKMMASVKKHQYVPGSASSNFVKATMKLLSWVMLTQEE